MAGKHIAIGHDIQELPDAAISAGRPLLLSGIGRWLVRFGATPLASASYGLINGLSIDEQVCSISPTAECPEGVDVDVPNTSLEQIAQQFLKILNALPGNGNQGLWLEPDIAKRLERAHRGLVVSRPAQRVVPLGESVDTHADFVGQSNQFTRQGLGDKVAIGIKTAKDAVVVVRVPEPGEQLGNVSPDERFSARDH